MGWKSEGAVHLITVRMSTPPFPETSSPQETTFTCDVCYESSQMAMIFQQTCCRAGKLCNTCSQCVRSCPFCRHKWEGTVILSNPHRFHRHRSIDRTFARSYNRSIRVSIVSAIAIADELSINDYDLVDEEKAFLSEMYTDSQTRRLTSDEHHAIKQSYTRLSRASYRAITREVDV